MLFSVSYSRKAKCFFLVVVAVPSFVLFFFAQSFCFTKVSNAYRNKTLGCEVQYTPDLLNCNIFAVAFVVASCALFCFGFCFDFARFIRAFINEMYMYRCVARCVRFEHIILSKF